MTKTAKTVLVSVPLMFLLLAIAIPNFVRMRTSYALNACANNLWHIQAAKERWALDKHKTTNDVPTWDDLRPYITPDHPMNVLPSCPDGGVYTIGRVGEPVRCSIGGVGHTLPSDWKPN